MDSSSDDFHHHHRDDDKQNYPSPAPPPTTFAKITTIETDSNGDDGSSNDHNQDDDSSFSSNCFCNQGKNDNNSLEFKGKSSSLLPCRLCNAIRSSSIGKRLVPSHTVHAGEVGRRSHLAHCKWTRSHLHSPQSLYPKPSAHGHSDYRGHVHRHCPNHEGGLR
jgi:hypothetical protein